MKKYIGTKTVQAKVMTLGEYNEYRGWDLAEDEDPLTDGYLVEYLDGGKPNDSRHAGYISWSPKDVFERSYKVLETPLNQLKIELVEVVGFPAVLRSLRFPHGLKSRSDVRAKSYLTEVDGAIEYEQKSSIVIDKKDLSLLTTLIKSGDEHSKVVRGIIVYVEITAPRFWWVEMDTYRVGTERLSSESTMHIQGKKLSTEELVEMKSNLTEGTLQKRSQYFSYQTLRRIYFQRKNHRLPHWRTFCEFIETLPLSNELILCKN